MTGKEKDAPVPGPELCRALTQVRRFVAETTGEEASEGEIARALCRYFVLNEIKEHVEMERSGE